MTVETRPAAASPADTAGSGGVRRHGARAVSVAVSAALLFAVYRSLDLRVIGVALLKSDPVWLAVSVGLIVPITVLRALRFLWVAPPGALPGLAEATRLTLAASALNVFLPLKAGDLIKSYFVARRSQTSAGAAVAVIVYERVCDLFGLLFWCLLGWVAARSMLSRTWAVAIVPLLLLETAFAMFLVSARAAAAWKAITARVLPITGGWRKVRGLVDGWPDLLAILRGRRRRILLCTLALWLAHLCQIWLFTVTLSAPVPFAACLSLAAVALLAGQVPMTIAGLGARDVAVVVLMAPFMAPETAAALAVLISTRNLLPPLIGLPIMRPYLASVVDEARRWQRQLPLARS
jgi:glycosyltransferase 2 family protein